MPSVPAPIIDTRRDQMFPTLEPSEIERVRRFGKQRWFVPGEPLAKVGERGVGLSIILSGQVEVTRYDSARRSTPIVTHGPGAFLGELAQLAGRPTLVDATARGPVEALIIPPDQLRALLIAEAELGERIMRALILRRVGLLETGAGGPLDSKGFVLTGASTDGSSRLLKTSVRGVFAIGDVRSGSTKRVAAAVGEGAQAVAALHAFLAENAIQPVRFAQRGASDIRVL